MGRNKPYSLTGRLGLVFTVTMIAAFVWIGHLQYTLIRERALEDELNRLENMVYFFEADLSKNLDAVIEIVGDDSLGRDKRILAINSLLQPLVEIHTADYPSVALGFYLKHLEAAVAVSPWDEMGHTLGVTLEPDHPSLLLYTEGPVQRHISREVRGKVARYAHLVFWQGEVVGHTWASIPIEVYYQHLMVVVIRVFPFFLLTMAGGILLLLFMSKEISRSADALGAEMDSLASNSQKGLGDVLVDYNYPVEFLSLFHRFADMSDRIQNLTDEFARSARLAAFGELATVIVHDIKNPLFIISATAQSGEWTTIEDEVNRTKFNKIVTATQEIDHYLKKILSIARTTPDQDRPVYIPDLFRRVLHLWEPVLARKGIELETDIDEMLPRVKGDIGNLQQVMLNLLINAVEAMPDGGVISLAATKCQNSIEISVSDTGHGIPEEVQPKIFKRFFTTKDQGTGVGLASGYAMITKLGGKMWFKSSEGKGTTFYIQLPIYDSPIDM